MVTQAQSDGRAGRRRGQRVCWMGVLGRSVEVISELRWVKQRRVLGISQRNIPGRGKRRQ